MWVPYRISSDGFGQYRGHRNRLTRCWWQSIQWKWGGIRGSKTNQIERINEVSPDSKCCFMANFIYGHTMEKYLAVTCEYWLMKQSIACEMNHLARCINLNSMRVTSVRILLGLILPKDQVSNMQKCNQYSQYIMNPTIDGKDIGWTLH